MKILALEDFLSFYITSSLCGWQVELPRGLAIGKGEYLYVSFWTEVRKMGEDKPTVILGRGSCWASKKEELHRSNQGNNTNMQLPIGWQQLRAHTTPSQALVTDNPGPSLSADQTPRRPPRVVHIPNNPLTSCKAKSHQTFFPIPGEPGCSHLVS